MGCWLRTFVRFCVPIDAGKYLLNIFAIIATPREFHVAGSRAAHSLLDIQERHSEIEDRRRR